MKTDLFQSCGHCWVFQIRWHVECSTLTASSFRIWNRSAGIPLSSLALLLVMLPKSQLTSHSRMSGSRWFATPSCLSGSLGSFLHSSVHSGSLSLHYHLILLKDSHFSLLCSLKGWHFYRYLIFSKTSELWEKKKVLLSLMGFPVVQGQRIHLQGKGHRERRFSSQVRKIPWRRKWRSTPVFLPGESHGQRSLAGYKGHRELDTTEETDPALFLITSDFHFMI